MGHEPEPKEGETLSQNHASEGSTDQQVAPCPNTGELAGVDHSVSTSPELGCLTQSEELSHDEVYEVYAAACPSSQRPQWGYLTYNSVTPGSSSILIEVAVGDAPTAFKKAAVAASHGHPANCTLAGPNPCPVHLFPLLGEPDVFDPTLHLRMTLQPGQQDMPTLRGWNVTFSCADAW
ncbi:hypothetical protein ACFL5O_06775 [Myxococcota bacterium]